MLNNAGEKVLIHSITFSSDTKPESVFDLAKSLITDSPNYKVGVTIKKVTCFVEMKSDFKQWSNNFNNILNAKNNGNIPLDLEIEINHG